MFDATRLLTGLVRGTASKGLRQASRQTGNSSILGGAVPGGGMLGLLGGLAIAAYEHYDQQQKAGDAVGAAPPPPPGAKTMPPPPPGAERAMPPPLPTTAATPPPAPGAAETASAEINAEHAMLLIQAMIAAAKADGEVDATESKRILGKLEEAGASADERSWVMAELAKPLDIASIVEQVHEPKLALEVYAASLMAIDVDTDAERRYLLDLGQRLRIEAPAVAEIHQALGVPGL